MNPFSQSEGHHQETEGEIPLEYSNTKLSKAGEDLVYNMVEFQLMQNNSKGSLGETVIADQDAAHMMV